MQPILFLLAVLVIVAIVARRLKIAPSILLVVAGIGVALVPGLPRIGLAPELVLLGTGPTQRFATAEVRGEFVRRRVGLEVMQLGAACRTFNVLVQEERRVLAALFLR